MKDYGVVSSPSLHALGRIVDNHSLSALIWECLIDETSVSMHGGHLEGRRVIIQSLRLVAISWRRSMVRFVEQLRTANLRYLASRSDTNSSTILHKLVLRSHPEPHIRLYLTCFKLLPVQLGVQMSHLDRKVFYEERQMSLMPTLAWALPVSSWPLIRDMEPDMNLIVDNEVRDKGPGVPMQVIIRRGSNGTPQWSTWYNQARLRWEDVESGDELDTEAWEFLTADDSVIHDPVGHSDLFVPAQMVGENRCRDFLKTLIHNSVDYESFSMDIGSTYRTWKESAERPGLRQSQGHSQGQSQG